MCGNSWIGGGKLSLVRTFSGYNVKYLTYVFSDHCPVLVDTISNDRSWMVREQNWFQLSVDWVLEDTCKEHIRNFQESSRLGVSTKLVKL